MLQYTRFFVFLSLSVIHEAHLDKFRFMTEEMYNILVEIVKQNFKAASEFYPLPTAYIKLTDSENCYSSQIYNTPIPARYIYIVATDSMRINTATTAPANPNRILVLKHNKEVARFPEMHFFGESFSTNL
ncbi:hypothetical protein AYI68_g5936 [Smittium mucronatum]|uniref:Uncharacterized protein n=1 Tax=Smittium mucronatum TaxID=133383 RepID=A0A1R0GSX5_9FUNG|nr:hypothetical protein AYI68_g5936 [Smittium mucronatum]